MAYDPEPPIVLPVILPDRKSIQAAQDLQCETCWAMQFVGRRIAKCTWCQKENHTILNLDAKKMNLRRNAKNFTKKERPIRYEKRNVKVL